MKSVRRTVQILWPTSRLGRRTLGVRLKECCPKWLCRRHAGLTNPSLPQRAAGSQHRKTQHEELENQPVVCNTLYQHAQVTLSATTYESHRPPCAGGYRALVLSHTACSSNQNERGEGGREGNRRKSAIHRCSLSKGSRSACAHC